LHTRQSIIAMSLIGLLQMSYFIHIAWLTMINEFTASTGNPCYLLGRYTDES